MRKNLLTEIGNLQETFHYAMKLIDLDKTKAAEIKDKKSRKHGHFSQKYVIRLNFYQM